MKNRADFLLWAAILLSPGVARADGIDLPIVLGLGIGVAIPLLTFNVVLEGFILSKFLKIRFRDLWRPMLLANIWSLLAGVPVCILNTIVAEALLPPEMVARMGMYPLAIVLGVVNYYVVTVIVEFWVIRRRCVTAQTVKPLAKGLLVGHLASYAILGPMLVLYATPKHTVETFVRDSQWAAQPPTPIVFLSPQAQLQVIASDGSGLRTLLTNEVRDFVVSPDLETILFRGRSNSYFLAHTGTVRLITSERIQCFGEGMDFSPDGRFAGLIDEVPELWLWDSHAGNAQKYPVPVPKPDSFRGLKLVWSTKPTVFYIAAGNQQTKGTISGAGSPIFSVAPDSRGADLADHFARIGRRERDAEDWDAPAEWLYKDGNRSFLVEHGLGNSIHVRCGNESLRISDNPGIFHFGNRQFVQAAFARSLNELIFDDNMDIYLANVPKHKVGLVAAGRRFVLLSAPFSKAERFSEWP